MTNALRFEPLYPDVLSAISPARITYDTFQAAVGLYPEQVYLRQVFEVVIILQSLIDQPQEMRVALDLPTKDGQGRPMAFEAPQRSLVHTLGPGEVAALILRARPLPPTVAGVGLPLAVTLQARVPRHPQIVRATAGGAPPTVITLSPFKLMVLRELAYAQPPTTAPRTTITLPLEINGRELNAPPPDLRPRIDSLWTQAQYPGERAAVAEAVEEARFIAASMTQPNILEPLHQAVNERFAARGLPLHPGEALAIAKMLTYTVDSGNALDEGAAPLERLRWFQSLCQLVAADPDTAHLPPGEVVAGPLFEAVLYDAVLLGFVMTRSRVTANLGDRNERAAYANKLLGWMTGQSEPDQSYIYLPLALGGVTVNALVVLRGENPWDVLDAISEAARGRVRLASRDVREVFDLLNKLLERASDDLRRERILRRP